MNHQQKIDLLDRFLLKNFNEVLVTHLLDKLAEKAAHTDAKLGKIERAGAVLLKDSTCEIARLSQQVAKLETSLIRSESACKAIQKELNDIKPQAAESKPLNMPFWYCALEETCLQFGGVLRAELVGSCLYVVTRRQSYERSNDLYEIRGALKGMLPFVRWLYLNKGKAEFLTTVPIEDHKHPNPEWWTWDMIS